ncbi:hypothetical protein Tco_1567236, partial [Tanacetum coccineum]
FVILDIIDDNTVPIILGRHMLATAHTRIDVFGRKIYLQVDVIDDFGRPEDLVELLKNDDINGDLGDFLEDNDLLPNFDAPKAISLSPSRLASINKDPFEEFQDSDSNMGIGIDDFVKGMDDLWDDQGPVSLTKEIVNPPLKLKFLSVGNRVPRHNPYNL